MVLPWILLYKKEINSPTTPKKNIIKKNLGKIFLKNLEAFSESNVVNTTEATTAVWKRIIPEIIPESSPKKVIN